MKDTARRIRSALEAAGPRLLQLDEESTGAAPAPGKWSKKQILGHLIDSATNNHQRFVRAQGGGAADFPPYDQNAWVEAQRYDEAAWAGLVKLWVAYNDHLCHVIERLPPEARSAPCNIGKPEPVTLEFVVDDYLRHLTHHVDQLLG